MWYNKEKRGGSTVQLKYHMLTIEDLVPVGHFLRKLEAVQKEAQEHRAPDGPKKKAPDRGDR